MITRSLSVPVSALSRIDVALGLSLLSSSPSLRSSGRFHFVRPLDRIYRFILFSTASLLLGASAVAQSYTFTDLGTVAPYRFFIPSAINNEGNVVGTGADQFGSVAFRYLYGRIDVVISAGPARSSWGNAINDTNTIAGQCDRRGDPRGGVEHAFYATQSGRAVDFDSDFSRNSEVLAINNTGYVVGTASGKSFIGHVSGWMFLLSGLGDDFKVRDLNNRWLIVGNGNRGGMTFDAEAGTAQLLGNFLGDFTNQAAAVNDAGMVAGKVGTQGYLYDAGTVLRFGTNVADVRSLNAAGDVVGTMTTERAFVYHRASSRFVDLTTAIPASVSSVWTLVSATGINDRGEICGLARRLATREDNLGSAIYFYTGYKLIPVR